MGRYCPKEGKNRRKVTNILWNTLVLLLQPDKFRVNSFGRLREIEIEMKGEGRMLSLSRVCVRAFQQRCCFFAVTSVTREAKNESGKEDFRQKRRSKKGVLLRFIVENLRRKIALLLKYILWIDVITCPLGGYMKRCDTCDSKNAKTPVVCAYACARGGWI